MPSISEAINKIDAFRDLAEGWRFGESGRPSDEAIEQAKYWVLFAANLNIDRANAFVGPDREIQVSFYSGNRAIEITFESDNTISFAEDLATYQMVFLENLDERFLPAKIWEFRYQYPSFAGSSIRETMITRRGVSTVPLSDLVAMKRPSPYLTQVVRLPKAKASAVTSADSTVTSQQNPDSFVSFPDESCLIPA
jgi:hypothetical protein